MAFQVAKTGKSIGESTSSRFHPGVRMLAGIVSLILVSGIAVGSVASVLLTSLRVLSPSLHSEPAASFLSLMYRWFMTLLVVLAVSLDVLVPGALAGFIVALVVVAVYVILVTVTANWYAHRSQRIFLPLTLLVAGAIGAILSCTALLNDVLLWGTLVGGLFGFVVGLVLVNMETEAIQR